MVYLQPQNVALMGIGNIGRGLIKQTLSNNNLRFVVIADTSGAIAKKQGFSINELQRIIDLKVKGKKLLKIADKFEYFESFKIASQECEYDIMIDASDADTHQLLFKELDKAHVLISNKKPIANTPYSTFKKLISKAKRLNKVFDYGVTVGAGIRIPDLVKALNTGGLDRIEGCLSGTMNYISQNINKGSTFSSSLFKAKSAPRYYTEPDPREDLNGNDFARKLVIIARLCGKSIETSDIEIEDILSNEFKSIPLELFLRNVQSLDEDIARRVKEAIARKKTMWYYGVADFNRGEYNIGFREIPFKDPIVGSTESDIFLKIYPKSWKRPMTVIGPGAGISETVTGILTGLNRVQQKIREGSVGKMHSNVPCLYSTGEVLTNESFIIKRRDSTV